MNRRRLWYSCWAACAVLGLIVALLTPWQPLGTSDAVVRPGLREAFTSGEMTRAASFRSALGAWPYVGLVLMIAAPWGVLAVITRSARLRRWSSTVHGIRRTALILLLVLAMTLLQWVVTVPTSVHSELVLRRFGLSTQGWSAWLADKALALGLAFSVTVAGIFVALWLFRAAPAKWPWLLAGVGVGMTMLGSLVYPIVVEPAFNAHSPLPSGQLRQRVERLAADEGFAGIKVAVSNASVRTTGENAHVSGFGATRWIVLDDTLVARARTNLDEVVTVVAHELGHVRHRDVLRGTAIGAAGVGAFVLLLSLGLTTDRARRAFALQSSRSQDKIRVVVFLLAVATTAPFAAAPVTNLVSRRIEASADVYALQATENVPAFIRMQHDLATSNLSRLDPPIWQTIMFATHPDPAWRIGEARVWQCEHGQR